MIPKIVHYCWYGPSPMTHLGTVCTASWRRLLGDFQIELWNERRLDLTIPYVKYAYEAGKYAFVADYVRLATLYQFGGVYLDTDIEVVRDIDDLLLERMFIGMESPQSVGVSVIGAQRGHPLLGAIIDRLDQEARSGRPTYRPLPDLVTEVLNETGRDGLQILPEEYFYPYNPYSPDPLRKRPLQSHITQNTRCIHHWEGSWLDGITLRELVVSRVRDLWRKKRWRWA